MSRPPPRWHTCVQTPHYFLLEESVSRCGHSWFRQQMWPCFLQFSAHTDRLTPCTFTARFKETYWQVFVSNAADTQRLSLDVLMIVINSVPSIPLARLYSSNHVNHNSKSIYHHIWIYKSLRFTTMFTCDWWFSPWWMRPCHNDMARSRLADGEMASRYSG